MRPGGGARGLRRQLLLRKRIGVRVGNGFFDVARHLVEAAADELTNLRVKAGVDDGGEVDGLEPILELIPHLLHLQ